MQNISIENVRKREKILSKSIVKENYSPNVSMVYNKLMESNKNQKNNIDFCMTNWEGLGSTIEFSIEKVLDLFDNVCDKYLNTNKGYVDKIANQINETVIPKTRNGVQTQNYIKYKLGRFKTNVSTKINNSVSNMNTAVSDSLTNKATPNNMSNTKTEEENKEEIKQEYYTSFYESANIIITCDRVLDNYKKVSTRFNVDNLVYEAVDMQDFVNTFSSLIDTYQLTNKNKFIITSETALYVLDKNHAIFEMSDILNYCADYYLIRENSNPEDIKKALSASVFYNPEDMKDLQYITELDPEDKDTKYNSFLNENSYDVCNVDNILEEFSAKETARDVINKFKLLPNKTIEAFKTAIKRVYTKSPDQIASEVPNILSVLRVCFIDGTAFAINPILGVLTLIVDQSIAFSLKRKETKKILDSYKNEKDKAEKKLKKLTDNDTIKRTKEYINSLDKNIEKIEQYYSSLLTDAENAERLSIDYDDSDDFSFDFSFDEVGNIVNESGEIINEMNFLNQLTLAGEKIKKAAIKLSDKDKEFSKNIEVSLNNFKKASERALTNENREAVIKGSILPSANKMIKAILVGGITAATGHPILAVSGVLGYIGCSSKMKSKERQMILDEIEIELKMVERYMKVAEDQNDLEAQRELLKVQRNLERQHQRIKYKMKVQLGQETGDNYKKMVGSDD